MGKLLIRDVHDAPVDAEWYCSVDYTNGYDENDESTHEPFSSVIGELDDWKEDHYGNKYAVKIFIYEPDSGEGFNQWRKVIER